MVVTTDSPPSKQFNSNYSPTRIPSLKAKAEAKAEREKFILALALASAFEAHKLLPVSSYV
jgi:hypothetical protein